MTPAAEDNADLRAVLAGMAMLGILAGSGIGTNQPDLCARLALAHADALLEGLLANNKET